MAHPRLGRGGRAATFGGYGLTPGSASRRGDSLLDFLQQYQTGIATITAPALNVTVVLDHAMPDTNYHVQVTARTAHATAGAVLLQFFVPDAQKTVNGFRIDLNGVVAPAANVDFYYTVSMGWIND